MAITIVCDIFIWNTKPNSTHISMAWLVTFSKWIANYTRPRVIIKSHKNHHNNATPQIHLIIIIMITSSRKELRLQSNILRAKSPPNQAVLVCICGGYLRIYFLCFYMFSLSFSAKIWIPSHLSQPAPTIPTQEVQVNPNKRQMGEIYIRFRVKFSSKSSIGNIKIL